MVQHGRVISGRYRLEHLLGEGGIGAVWAATHLLTNKRVAVKLLKPEVATPDTLRRFIREGRAASAVRHPNVVEVHDLLSLDDGSPALVMDLLEGETLGQRLRRSGALPLSEVIAIMAPVLSAVGCAHAAGIIHRDLKPDNIFLARLGDGRMVPMVLDFGMAKLQRFEESFEEGAQLTRTGIVMGTPHYMAPEQAFGERDIDGRVDVWALGLILYECATGKKAVAGDTLGQVFKSITIDPLPRLVDDAPELPLELRQLVDRMMSRDRDARPHALHAPLELLCGVSLGAPTGLRSSSLPLRLRRVATRVRLVAAAAGLMLFTIGLAVIRPSTHAEIAPPMPSSVLSRPLAIPAQARVLEAGPIPTRQPPAGPVEPVAKKVRLPQGVRPAAPPKSPEAAALESPTASIPTEDALPGGISSNIPF